MIVMNNRNTKIKNNYTTSPSFLRADSQGGVREENEG